VGTRPETQIEIVTPVITLKKSEIIQRGLELGAPLQLTWSCYQNEDAACGVCDSCLLRLRAFAEAGATDPIPYRQSVFRRALSLPVVGRLGISTLERDNGSHIVRHLREGLPVKKESGVMKSSDKSWVLAAMMLVALAGAFAPRAAAQGDSTIKGQILDVAGKPWADMGVQAVSDQGAKSETKRIKDGNYVFSHLRAGVYSVFVLLPAPNKPYEGQSGSVPARKRR